MRDGFQVAIRGVREIEADFKRINRNVERATMYTVREAGRRVKREAKRAAPVYRGANATRRMRKGEQGPMTNPNQPVSGLLRASIASSRRLHREERGGYAVRVAPRGARVHLYSLKIEALRHYMRDGYSKVAPEVHRIAEQAWTRATRRR